MPCSLTVYINTEMHCHTVFALWHFQQFHVVPLYAAHLMWDVNYALALQAATGFSGCSTQNMYLFCAAWAASA